MLLGEAFDVQLINHRLVPWRSKWLVAVPRKCGIHDTGEWRAMRGVHSRSQYCILPLQVPRNGFGIGIEQDLGRIKTMSSRRRKRTVHSVAVDLPRLHPRQKAVPHL